MADGNFTARWEYRVVYCMRECVFPTYTAVQNYVIQMSRIK